MYHYRNTWIDNAYVKRNACFVLCYYVFNVGLARTTSTKLLKLTK